MIKRITEDKITITLKRANGLVETLDISAKFKGTDKIGFEYRILPQIISANAKNGTTVLSWTFEAGKVESIISDADKKTMASDAEYADHRRKVLGALNA